MWNKEEKKDVSMEKCMNEANRSEKSVRRRGFSINVSAFTRPRKSSRGKGTRMERGSQAWSYAAVEGTEME